MVFLLEDILGWVITISIFVTIVFLEIDSYCDSDSWGWIAFIGLCIIILSGIFWAVVHLNTKTEKYYNLEYDVQAIADDVDAKVVLTDELDALGPYIKKTTLFGQTKWEYYVLNTEPEAAKFEDEDAFDEKYKRKKTNTIKIDLGGNNI